MKIVLVLMSLLMMSCATTSGDGKLLKKGRHNVLMSIMKPFTPKRFDAWYKHTLYHTDRVAGDCQPNCPLVDTWQYLYRPAGSSETIVSDKPISTQQKYWKSKREARIISISHWDDKELYFNGLINFLDSINRLNIVNRISSHEPWGMQTFTVRVYVSKRNPIRLTAMGPYLNGTSDWQIEKLLSLGCEVVYVDNGLPEALKDGTFWRFMVAAEPMPEGQRIRYLIRDSDWFISGAEAFAVGEWIASGLDFHRNHQLSICLGPMTCALTSGSHVGKGIMPDLRNRIETFPYRFRYGDDELFTRDVMWPTIKYAGSILTHTNNRNILTRLSNPYNGSCEEPTQAYCDSMRPGGKCEDREMPPEVQFPQLKLGMRDSYEKLKVQHDLFDMHLNSERGKLVRQAFDL